MQQISMFLPSTFGDLTRTAKQESSFEVPPRMCYHPGYARFIRCTGWNPKDEASEAEPRTSTLFYVKSFCYKAVVSIVLILLCCHAPIQGQSDRIYRPNWSIKFNPLAPLNHTPGIELGLEHTISENTSIHLGASYLSDFGVFPNKNFDGYRFLGEYRMYRPPEHQHKNTFLAFQFNYKRTKTQGQVYLDRANGNYQQLTEVKVVNTTLEFLGAYGKVFPLSPRFSLDMSLAIGARWLSVASDDIPPDAAFNLFNDNVFDFTVNSLGNVWYPLFRPQFKLNFELN